MASARAKVRVALLAAFEAPNWVARETLDHASIAKLSSIKFIHFGRNLHFRSHVIQIFRNILGINFIVVISISFHFHPIR